MSPSRREPVTPAASPYPGTPWQRATYRWIAITVVMGVLLVWYGNHPYYRQSQFQPFRSIYPGIFATWLFFGLFYARVTVQRFSSMRYMMRDTGLHFLLLAKRLRQGRFWRSLKRHPRLKTTVLAVVVKGFFVPLMLGFVTNHINGIWRQWLAHKHLHPPDIRIAAGTSPAEVIRIWSHELVTAFPALLPTGQDLVGLVTPWTWSRQDLSWGLGFVYDLIFFVDCGWALMGYASESRWLGNKTKSVEPTSFGWAVALACYPPFNNVLGTYLPLENGPAVITSDGWLLALRAGVVVLFSIYAAATVAFGFKFSNLTNRGIVSRGPYRFIRHPAYSCKCTAWWLEHLPTMTFTKAIFLTGLCGVYALRAWTEERHLSLDPDYRAYKARVRWVIFPGLF